MTQTHTEIARVEAERADYSDGRHMKNRKKIKSWISFVYNCPNSLYVQNNLRDRIKKLAKGATVLDVGCGTGWYSEMIMGFGAASVHGVDVSVGKLEQAYPKATDKLTFAEHDIHQPLEGSFDLILGSAILHHVDYQSVLKRLYDNNLELGGEMLFVEPLGEGLLMRLYWSLGSRFHTSEERPFFRKDLTWLSQTFEGFDFEPTNYFSLPAALLSAIFFEKPDNPLTRLSDRMDRFVARRLRFLAPRFRSAVFRIRKPHG